MFNWLGNLTKKKSGWCYSKVACRRHEVKTNSWCNRSRGKKVREEGSATSHFVHSDMMKYMITDSEHSVKGEGESDTQGEMKKEGRNAWNVPEGEWRRKRGLKGGTQGDMNRLQSGKEKWTAGGEICTVRCMCSVNFRVWVCIRMHLYTDAYSYLVACLEQTCRRTPVNIICKNKHLPIQLSVSS